MQQTATSTQQLALSQTSLENGYKSDGHVKIKRRGKIPIILTAALVLALVAAVVVLAVLYAEKDSDSEPKSNKISATTNPTGPTNPTSPAVPNCPTTTDGHPPGPPNNPDGPFTQAAVAADDIRCSDIGLDILKRNGSAVDAAIAALFCIGVINMHSAGIGGGSVMVVYNRTARSAQYFNFRETAPGAANELMFVNKSTASQQGGLAIAVPGEVKGLYNAWKKYGKLQWKELVKPAINLTRKGFIIHPALDRAIKASRDIILETEGLRELLVKKDNCLKKLGDRLVNPKLAITLERISYDPMSFYEGELAEDVLRDISSHNGIITEKDLRDYKVQIDPAITSSLGNYDLHTTGLPSSGIIVAFIMNVLKGYKFNASDVATHEKTAATYHKIIEAFKYAYARRALLGDKNFANVSEIYADLLNETYAESIRRNISLNQTFHNPRHYGGYYSNYDAPGTSHLSVLAANGDAVSVTSTINTYFGSKVRSMLTGIIYNNEMDDFSTPGLTNAYGVDPSPSNFIKPGKRPMSSMCPIILTNKTGDVVFIAGAAGGTRITTGTVLVTMNKLWFGYNTSDAVNMPRFHDQLLPDYTATEQPPYNMTASIIDALKTYGHNVESRSYFSVVQAISREQNGQIYAKSDPRKGGYSNGY